MTRAIETAISIARLQSSVETLAWKIESGFSRNDDGMSKVETLLAEHKALLSEHDKHLTALQAREARNRAITKWVAGVFAAVVSGFVLMFLKS